METLQSLSHSRWACKFHVVWIPRCRKKKRYGPLRKELGAVFHARARQKECPGIEGHLLLDHGPMLISIPPKYAVSRVIGFIKGKSAIHVARTWGGRQKNFTGQSFWARGYYVSRTGKDEEEVRHYIRAQEEEDRRLDPLDLFDE